MNISDEQIKKIFELASMESKLKQGNITSNDISQALIEIERKVYSFSNEVNIDVADSKKILIADDLELSIFQLTTLLKKIGVNPSVARNKEEAISEIQKKHFDCIIIDLFIPDSADGFELIKTAIERKNESGYATSLVAISGTDDETLVNRCYQLGVDFYIQKDNDWHSKLLKYLGSIFETEHNSSFEKRNINSETVLYSVRKLHEGSVFEELKQNVNLSLYNGLKNILLDLKEIATFDVENAYIFTDLFRICADNQGTLILVNPSRSIKEVLEFAYLIDIIPCAYSIEDAIKKIINKSN